MIVSSYASYHWVNKISAHTHATQGAPLILTLTGLPDVEGCQINACEITIYTKNQALTDCLVAAINSVAQLALGQEQVQA
jgi:hypothetical protein